MKNEITFVVEEAVEGGFTAHALGEGIVTEADTLAELHAMIRDAVDCHFEPSEKPSLYYHEERRP